LFVFPGLSKLEIHVGSIFCPVNSRQFSINQMIMKYQLISAIVVLLSMGTAVHCTEPNENFGSATVLSPGVMTVTDALTSNAPAFPDTLLGIRNGFDTVYFTDDDSSPLGDGRASATYGEPTNSGSISFSITGFGDDTFDGFHSEQGQYKVYVDVYDFFDDPIDSFSEMRTLAPGIVHDFSFDNFEWIGGTYDVYIDNALALTSDVDFFTFTGLTPGTQFMARTADPAASGVNTLLGWFDSSGGLLESDDNGAGGLLSQIDGIVPAGGMLTFAVSGVGDNGFAGSHTEDGSYELRLQIQTPSVPGDYNKNNVVDAADYVIWRNTLNQSGLNLLADGDGDGTVDNDDYGIWRSHFGKTAGSGTVASANATVPEPATLVMLMFAASGWYFRRRLFELKSR
jgi:hypothetical protein